MLCNCTVNVNVKHVKYIDSITYCRVLIKQSDLLRTCNKCVYFVASSGPSAMCNTQQMTKLVINISVVAELHYISHLPFVIGITCYSTYTLHMISACN